MPMRNRKPPTTLARKVGICSRREVDDRVRPAAGVTDVERSSDGPDGEQGGDERVRQEAAGRRCSKPNDQAGEAEAEERGSPRQSKRRRPLLADVGDEQRDEHEAEDADRDVDPEDPAPVEIGGDEAADRRPEHRADQGRHGEPGERRTSSALGTVRSRTSRPTGTIIAPPMPWTMRASTKSSNE